MHEPYRASEGQYKDTYQVLIEKRISLTKWQKGESKLMARVKGTKALSAYKMAKRISDRKDNVYDKRIIENILNMYMDECRKALLSGERVQITRVGTIIPEVKSRLFYNLPRCNKEEYKRHKQADILIMADKYKHKVPKKVYDALLRFEVKPYVEDWD